MARPKKPDTENIEQVDEAAPVTVVRTRDLTASRPKRVSLADQRDMMTTPQRSGFVRRWVNDVGNRVEKFKLAGYSVVEDKDVQVGDEGVINNNIALGSGARKHVGRTRGGDNSQAVLMEIPQEWYDEDQAAKQKKVDESEADIKRKTREKDFYGEFRTTSSLSRTRKDSD